MRNNHIGLVVILGALSLAGIVFTQIYWVSEAIQNQEDEFNHNVQMALRNVVESLCEINGNDISNDPIDQVSNNYFIARTNYKIDLSSLDYLLKAEFQKRSLTEDFEFGVYDCSTDRMVYGDFVSMSNATNKKPLSLLPKLDNDEYYFGVYFPGKTAGIVGSLGFWQFTTLITVVIVIFFAYSLFIILRQKRLGEIQRDFINNVTHELKTPLATLLISAEAIDSEVKSERAKTYSKIIRSESNRLQRHVNQLLQLSLSASGSKLSKELVDINEMIEQMLRTFLISKEITMNFKRSTKTLRMLAVPEEIEKVIFNLLDNAVKYGNGKVTVETGAIDKSAFISIADNGSGFDPRESRRIFRRFYRISSGDVHNVKGFGLGLHLVKKAVKSLKGKIKVETSKSGSTFTLYLPITDHD